MQITKNISNGEPIMHLNEINNLAKDGKSVIVQLIGRNYYQVRPAAFIQNWSLRECSKYNFFYSIKTIK